MKQLTSYNRVAGYLNKLFDLLNERFFENALQRPTITIQSTPRAYGHFSLSPDTWVSVTGSSHEINIGAGTISRPIEEVAATLLHEMVHYYNYKNGVQDCSRGNTYHNKRFKFTAESHGLHVEHDSKYGWTMTTPNNELLDFILENQLSDIYEKVEAVVSADTILASSTSAITPDDLCKNLTHPQRFLVAHPFQPAHLQPLVELVGSSRTSPGVIAAAKKLLEETLHRQVVVLHQGVPGFIVNRIAQAMFRECISMVENDVASVEDIDKAIKYAVGMRYASIGLLEYFDDVGFDLEKNIAESVYPSLCNTRDIQPSVLAGIASGNTGLTAGKGLYDWNVKDVTEYQLRKTAPLLNGLDWDFPTKA